MFDAAELVRRRMINACSALKAAELSYVVVGGCAVWEWVASVDRAAVRTSPTVELLVQRADLERIKAAMGRSGFTHRQVEGRDLFFDDPTLSPGKAVHIVFAGEPIRGGERALYPDTGASVELGCLRVISLEALVRVKLTAFRREDQVHLLDLMGVGLIDRGWTVRFPPHLAVRLATLLDSPDR